MLIIHTSTDTLSAKLAADNGLYQPNTEGAVFQTTEETTLRKLACFLDGVAKYDPIEGATKRYPSNNSTIICRRAI